MPRLAGFGKKRKKRTAGAGMARVDSSTALPTPKKTKRENGVTSISPPRSTKHELPTPARKLVNFFRGLLSFNDNDMRKTISIVLNRLEESIQDNSESSASALDVINLVDDEEQADEERPHEEQQHQPQRRQARNEFIIFKDQKNGDKERTFEAAKKKKNRSVMKIVDAILDSTNTCKQQVLALHLAVKHKSIRNHSILAGIVNDNAAAKKTIVSKLRETISLARRTDHI